MLIAEPSRPVVSFSDAIIYLLLTRFPENHSSALSLAMETAIGQTRAGIRQSQTSLISLSKLDQILDKCCDRHHTKAVIFQLIDK